MRKEYWGEIPDGPEAREWVRNIMDQSIWTVKDVQGLYGLSQSTVSRLYTKHDWKFAFKKGNQILFLADYAKPWFDQYNTEQNVNRSNEKVQPKKKSPGRPKKVKGEYEYMLLGAKYKDTRPPSVVHAEWLARLAQDFPQYYKDLDKAIVKDEVMLNREHYQHYFETVLPLRTAINEAFKQFKGL